MKDCGTAIEIGVEGDSGCASTMAALGIGMEEVLKVDGVEVTVTVACSTDVDVSVAVTVVGGECVEFDEEDAGADVSAGSSPRTAGKGIPDSRPNSVTQSVFPFPPVAQIVVGGQQNPSLQSIGAMLGQLSPSLCLSMMAFECLSGIPRIMMKARLPCEKDYKEE